MSKTNNLSFETLFDEYADLVNTENWILQADYISLKEEKFSSQYSKVLGLLKVLFRNEVSDLYIDTNTRVPKVYFKTH